MTPKRKPKALPRASMTKHPKAWAVMYDDKPDKIYRTFVHPRLLIYANRRDALRIDIGPVRRVTITWDEKP